MRSNASSRPLAFVALALFSVAGAAASAQNIVLDPGFENAVAGPHTALRTSGGFLADLGDGAWTVTQDTLSVNGSAHTGSLSVVNFDDAPVSFQQTLVTTPGQFYNLSFYAAFTSGFSTLNGMFGSTPFSIPNRAPGGGTPGILGPYQQFTIFNLPAPTNSAVLSFTISHPLGGTRLDDVSVIAVPEPGALAALLASGLAGAGMFLKRRRIG